MGGPCWRNLGMVETQTLRASLANERVSDEECFMVLEPNPLGFHVRLWEGTMTQQLEELPGHSQWFLPPNRFPVSVALAALPCSPRDLFSRAALGSRKALLELKTGSLPHSPGQGARKEYVRSDTPAVRVPIMSALFTITRHFLWHRSPAKSLNQRRGND